VEAAVGDDAVHRGVCKWGICLFKGKWDQGGYKGRVGEKNNSFLAETLSKLQFFGTS
jgi:hypothetical protein